MKIHEITGTKVRYSVKSNSSAIFSEDANVLVSSGLIDKFESNDRVKINSCVSKGYFGNREVIGNVYLSIALTAILIIAISISPKMTLIFDFIQPGGVLIFPLSFVIIDVINEVYGRRAAQRVIYGVAANIALCAFFVMLLMAMKDVNVTAVAYHTVFDPLPKLFIINGVCILLADTISNSIYSYVRHSTNGRWLLLRCVVSTIIGQYVYTIVWVVGFYGGDMSIDRMLLFIHDNYWFKVAYGLLLVPITWGLVELTKKLTYPQN